MIKLEDLENMARNQYLKSKLETLLSIENDLEKQYRMAQAILEYINVYYITVVSKRKLEDYNIMKIIDNYATLDEEIFDQMVAINSLYNQIDQKEYDKEDIEYLLLKIDYIYELLKNKYVEIKDGVK